VEKSDRITKFRIAVGVLLAIWMIVIFALSAQPAAESEMTSGAVSFRLVAAFDQCFDMGWNEGECMVLAEFIDHPVRKAAHMTEYAILCSIWFVLFWGGVTDAHIAAWDKIKKYRIYAVIFSMLYACTDEFHQLFVVGRAGRFIDVCIDTAGAIIGVMITGFIVKKIIKHCANRKIQLQ
jgi:VanZ family protein